ncbi:MAG: efflux RND transporter periplasmic adaptor subunit [Pyrinomonadaceae bacterium]
MKDKVENSTPGEAPPTNSVTSSGGRRTAPIVGAIVAIVAIIGIVAIWLLWPKPAGRPVAAPRTVTFDESSPATTTAEQKLTLTPEQLRSVQLKIEMVGEAPTTEAAAQMATGVVQANSYKETPVVSLVGGIVRSVNGELGQNVRRGQRVAIVFSNELAEAQAGYLTAVAALDEHHRHHLRTIKLVEIGAASRQELESATTQYRESEANVANLRQKLLLLGMTAQRIASLKSPSQVNSEVTVPAPASGTITSRTVNSGEVIEANKELLRVTDLSTVWVIGQVYEKDLATVRVGSGANITSDAYPGQVFRGRVTYVDPKIDPATRTAQVRIEIANPRQMFKIGMFVNVAFGALGVAEQTLSTVPKNAVQTIGTQRFVFVATDKPNEFILRPVRVGAESNGFYPVLEGLNAGERVVTEGSFMLRAEWLKTNPVSHVH